MLFEKTQQETTNKLLKKKSRTVQSLCTFTVSRFPWAAPVAGGAPVVGGAGRVGSAPGWEELSTSRAPRMSCDTPSRQCLAAGRSCVWASLAPPSVGRKPACTRGQRHLPGVGVEECSILHIYKASSCRFLRREYSRIRYYGCIIRFWSMVTLLCVCVCIHIWGSGKLMLYYLVNSLTHKHSQLHFHLLTKEKNWRKRMRRKQIKHGEERWR